MEFLRLGTPVEEQFNKMAAGELYVVDISTEDLWNFYLDAYPEGTNLLLKERREYDCNCCKNFVRNIGNVVSFIDGKIETVWDVETEGYYVQVAEKMKALILSKNILSVFRKTEKQYGTKSTPVLTDKGKVETWYHFHAKVPAKFVVEGNSEVGKINTRRKVFKRGLEELTVGAMEIVLELTDQNSLYKGPQFRKGVQSFLDSKIEYDKTPEEDKEIFIWKNIHTDGARVRNSAIGTLLQDLSEGADLTKSVMSYESKVDSSNYKRSTAVVTEGMKKQALKKIKELGIEDSLFRRFANIKDITINNILWGDKSATVLMKDSIESFLDSTVTAPVKTFDKVEEVSIEDFINKIVPKADSIEILLKNKHQGNLMSLIAPVDEGAKNILKWDNNYSWAYNGGLTDTELKRKVSAAGGRVDGPFRFSHSWNQLESNKSLMDLHVFMPGNVHRSDDKCHESYGVGRRVGWNNRTDGQSGGIQDVDYTEEAPTGYIPVENITFSDINKMPEGKYICKIHNWSFRKSGGRGTAEIEINGELFQYEYPKTKNHQWITVAEVTLKNGEFSIVHKLPTSSTPKDIWSVKTETFQKVSAVMMSPNYWDNQEQGSTHKHFFFILDGCLNPDPIRGLFNEFLMPELNEVRKTFEVLGNKMMCPYTDDQLSGIGFSVDKRAELIVKVTGKFNRNLKVKF